LNVAGFSDGFLVPVISRIKSIGGGWGRGWVRSQRRVKATIWTQTAVLCLQYLTLSDTIHEVGKCCRQEQSSTPCSPINAPEGHKMHPRGSTTPAKAVYKSRLGHLCSSTWCFWVVHKCNFQVLAKSGFQLMRRDG